MAPYYTNPRPVNEREMALIEKAAGRLWQQRTGRDVYPGMLVTDTLYDGEAPVDGYGSAGGQMLFNGRYVGVMLNRVRKSRNAKTRRDAVGHLYGLMAHELGHVLGYGHTDDTGIMQPDGDRRALPYDYRGLAKEVLGDRYYNPKLWRKTPNGWVRRHGS